MPSLDARGKAADAFTGDVEHSPRLGCLPMPIAPSGNVQAKIQRNEGLALAWRPVQYRQFILGNDRVDQPFRRRHSEQILDRQDAIGKGGFIVQIGRFIVIVKIKLDRKISVMLGNYLAPFA